MERFAWYRPSQDTAVHRTFLEADRGKYLQSDV
jgi:hypothetical protein